MAPFIFYDMPTLVALGDYADRHNAGRVHWEWARPMDLGAAVVSGGHATALTRLLALGLVERRQRTDTGPATLRSSRASWEYRITPAGRAKLAERNTDGTP